ncbi:hypothetical protein [Halopseudomonas pelagia]|nr:hypothetical protein [Halopseudomonas pelagia]
MSSVPGGVKDMALRFGISDRIVSTSLNALEACGTLKRIDLSAGPGKPARQYQLSESIKTKLKGAGAVFHEKAIIRVLQHEKNKGSSSTLSQMKGLDDPTRLAALRSRKQTGRLSIVNRLLVAVLLCGADKFGVVSKLGSASIRNATGLSQARLIQRIARLVSLGVLRAYVPGHTSSILLKKTKSIYFINLNHPELSNGVDVTAVVAIKPPFAMRDADFPLTGVHLRSIWLDIEQKAKYPKFCEYSSYEQALIFLKNMPRTLFGFLQGILEQSAAFLLSKHWRDVVRDASGEQRHIEELCRRFEVEFRVLAYPAGERSDNNLSDIVIPVLADMAFELAISLKKLLTDLSIPGLQFEDMAIVPQPFELGYESVVLLLQPRSDASWRGCLVSYPFKDHIVTRTYTSEMVIAPGTPDINGLLPQVIP